jgi:hypothetical protein
MCRAARRVRASGIGVWILAGALRRQRPLGPHRLVELVAEEALLQAAVDDVPGQAGVLPAIAEDERVGVEAGLGDGGAPLAAVALGGDDRRATRRSPSDSSAW